MANWSCTIPNSAAIVKDATSGVVNVTATFTNSVTSEVQTRVWPVTTLLDTNWFKSQAQQVISQLNNRDANYVALQAAITAAGGGPVTLATG